MKEASHQCSIGGTKGFCVALFAFLFALCSGIQAQPTKIPRISYLTLVPRSVNPARIEAFRQGLRDLGYIEGKNIFIEWRYAEENRDQLPALASELVRLHVEVIVTGGPLPTQAAKKATKTIPIVFTQVSDPVAEGLVASLARPGGNITGLSQTGSDLAGKRLELLKEASPKISRVAALFPSASESALARLKETQSAAVTMGLQVLTLEVQTLNDFERAFKAATTMRAGALIVLQSAFTNTSRHRIVELAATSRLPTMFEEASHVDAGGFMSYGPSFFELQRRAAWYVDKILKGVKPADLPVEQPTKFELVINLKTAKQIGLTVPPNVLARADRVIR